MMARIKGITITLYEVVEAGKDGFNKTIYEETPVQVENVLIAPATGQDIVDATNLYGKRAVYTLAIPKGDTHVWEDRRVEFFGQSWRVFGCPTEGIEDNIPLYWNKKVMVERYG